MKQLVLTCRKCSRTIDLLSVPKGFEISSESITVTFHCPFCDKKYRIKGGDEKWLEILGDIAKEFFGFDLIALRKLLNEVRIFRCSLNKNVKKSISNTEVS